MFKVGSTGKRTFHFFKEGGYFRETLVVEERELRQKSWKIQMGGAQGVCFQMRGEINLEILRHSYSSMTAGR